MAISILKTYSVSADITAGICEPVSMSREIGESATIDDFRGVNLDGDVLEVRGESILDETALDLVVQNHDGQGKANTIDRDFQSLSTSERNSFLDANIDEGGLIFNNTTDKIQYWDGTEWLIPRTDDPALQTEHFFEEDNSTATTINNLVDFEDLNISLAANSLNTLGGLSVSGNTITRTGSATRVYAVWWSINAAPIGGTGREYTLKAFKNGTTALDGQSLITIDVGRNSDRTIMTMVSLDQNDTIDFKVRAENFTVDFVAQNTIIFMKRAD